MDRRNLKRWFRRIFPKRLNYADRLKVQLLILIAVILVWQL